MNEPSGGGGASGGSASQYPALYDLLKVEGVPVVLLTDEALGALAKQQLVEKGILQSFCSRQDAFDRLIAQPPGLTLAMATELLKRFCPPGVDDETLEMLRNLLKHCTPPSATSGQSKEGVRDERALVQVKKTAMEYHAVEAYGSDQVSCMVMGVKLPAFMVSMSHITPRHWWRGAGELLQQVTGLTGCDDRRNIMFMLKCFEYTLDRMRWTPMYSEKGYLVHILDPSLRDVVIWDMLYSGAKEGASLVDRDKLLAAKPDLPDVFGKPFTSLKFSDFDKKPMTLMSAAIKAGNEPSKRCCNVHAIRSAQEAKKHSWIKNLSDVGLSPEAWSSPDALESQRKVLAWFGAKEEVDVKHQDQDDEDQGADASWQDGDEDVSKNKNPFSALSTESSD